MQSNRARAAVAVASVVLIAVAFVFLSAEDEDLDTATLGETTIETTTTVTDEVDEPKPEIPTIVVEGGEPKGGLADLNYTKGEKVEFKVESDVDEEVHVHGYDIFEEVSAGGTARFAFDADIDGVYEVELERSGVQLAQLTVKP
jgi:hypothetical protein